MEDMIACLSDAGYMVRFAPGRDNGNVREPHGVTCYVESPAYFMAGKRDEAWQAHDSTPEGALIATCNQMHAHMRPGYVAYVKLAKALGWEL